MNGINALTRDPTEIPHSFHHVGPEQEVRKLEEGLHLILWHPDLGLPALDWEK